MTSNDFTEADYSNAIPANEPPRQRVNILMATFNGARNLGQQIESIQMQSHHEWELFVSDDGSSDATPHIVSEYSKADPRIHLLPAPAVGGSAQANFLSGLTSTPSGPLMLCDQDDFWFVDKVRLSVDALRGWEAAPDKPRVPRLIHTDARVVDDELVTVHPSQKRFSGNLDQKPSLGHSLVENSVTGNTTLLSEELVELLRMTPPRTPMIMHDWWIYILAAAFGEVIYLDTVTLAYRQHAVNTVGARRKLQVPTIARMREAKSRTAATVAQARSFLSVYGSILPPDAKNSVSTYAALTSVPRRSRITSLRRSGLTKIRPTARLAHYASVLTLSSDGVSTALQ